MTAKHVQIIPFDEAWFWQQIERARVQRFTANGCMITPSLAEFMLTQNITNRRVYDEHVARLAEDMRNGRWEENGETIKFSLSGELNDGQHRLFASALNGLTFISDVAFGVTRTSRLTVDQGRKRTAADIITLRDNMSNALTHAGAIRVLLTLQAVTATGDMRIGPRFTAVEVAAHIGDFPGLADCVTRAKHFYTTIRRPNSSIVAALMFLTDKVNMSASAQFWRKLETGLDMPSEFDPTYLLRQRLQQLSYTKQKLNDYDMIGLVIKAWNYSRQGRELKILMFNHKHEKWPRAQ